MFFFFFFNDTATTEIYTLSLHDALPIYGRRSRFVGCSSRSRGKRRCRWPEIGRAPSELQSPDHLVCRLLLEKKKKINKHTSNLKEIRRKPNLSQPPGLLYYSGCISLRRR